MAYTISNTDGTVLTLLADGTIDQTASSLTLIGKNVNGFGQYLNNNLIQLLANSANTSGNPPRSPLKGQVWYDTTTRKLKVYDNGFKNVGGVTVSTSLPVELSTGDLWFDSTNMQLKILNGATLYTVGPLFPLSVGSNGWIVPAVSIKDNSNTAQQVTVLQNYGTTIGVMSGSSFKMSTADSLNYFNASSQQTVVSGLTISGDVSVTGKISSKQLSLYIDIDTLSTTINGIGESVSDPSSFGAQNNAIRNILTNMFPPNGGNDLYLDPATSESGVPYGSVCKVLCRYAQGGTNDSSGGIQPGEGYQIRRFTLNNVGAWEYTNTTELSL
jgi:hypothetical protein